MAESILLKNDPTGSGRLLIELLDMTSVITANVQVENNKKGEEKSKNGHQEKMRMASQLVQITEYMQCKR